ncbi:hypothetical protein VTK26DRAFT_9522 [Humicola hyalothermophila]
MVKARVALEDALTWHSRMARLTDYRYRQFPARWKDLGFITCHRVPGGSVLDTAVIIWYNWAVVKSHEIFNPTDTLLGFRYALIERAIQQLRLHDISEAPTDGVTDAYQIIQVHNFRGYRFLYSRLRHKLHHIWDMRFVLDRFYPGFFQQTEIIGLSKIHHSLVSQLLARRTSSSKWRRGWHSSRTQWQLELELPQIIGAYPSTYSEERLPGIDPDWLTPSTTDAMSSATTALMATPPARVTQHSREQRDGGAKVPSHSNQVLPPRKPWYSRTRRSPREKALRAWAHIGYHFDDSGKSHSSDDGSEFFNQRIETPPSLSVQADPETRSSTGTDVLRSSVHVASGPNTPDRASKPGGRDGGTATPTENPSPRSGASKGADSGVPIHVHLDTRSLPPSPFIEDGLHWERITTPGTEAAVLLEPRYFRDEKETSALRVLRRKPAMNLRAAFKAAKLATE